MLKTRRSNICEGRALRIVFAITVLVIFTMAQAAMADDWPMYRHDPAHTGTSNDIIHPPLSLSWKYASGSIVTSPFISSSSPVVSSGIVYTGLRDYNVYALDALTGALKWKYLTGGGVYSSPAVADGVVYVGSEDFYVYALNASTGTLKWKYATRDTIASSPTISDSL